jgi:hypothetical protein
VFLEPRHVEAYQELCKLLARGGRFGEAVHFGRRLLENHPDGEPPEALRESVEQLAVQARERQQAVPEELVDWPPPLQPEGLRTSRE